MILSPTVQSVLLLMNLASVSQLDALARHIARQLQTVRQILDKLYKRLRCSQLALLLQAVLERLNDEGDVGWPRIVSLQEQLQLSKFLQT